MNNINIPNESKNLLEFENRQYFQFLDLLFRNFKKILFFSIISAIIFVLITSNFIAKDNKNIQLLINSISAYETNKYYSLNELNIKEVPVINQKTLFEDFISEIKNKKKIFEITKLYIDSKKIKDSKKIEHYYKLSKSIDYESSTTNINAVISLNLTNSVLSQNDATDFSFFLINQLNNNVKKKLIISIEDFIVRFNSYNEIKIYNINSLIENELNTYLRTVNREVATLKDKAEIDKVAESSILNVLKKYPDLYNKSNFNIDSDTIFLGGYVSTLKKIDILEKRIKKSNFEKYANILNLQNKLYETIHSNDVKLINMAMKTTPLDEKFNDFKSINYFVDDLSIVSTSNNLSRYQLMIIFFIFFALFYTIIFLSKDGYDRYSIKIKKPALS